MAKRPAQTVQKRPSERPGRLIGYARVSTAEQSLQLQLDALVRAGVEADDIHSETVSGAAARRPRLKTALLDCRSGDTLVVWKLDRLGRSLIDLLNRLADMEQRGVGFKSLTEGIDTTTAGGRLIMHVMGALAQFERDLIRERTRAGVATAKARGVQFGGKKMFKPKDVAAMKKMRDGGASLEKIAQHYECSRQTVYNYLTGRR